MKEVLDIKNIKRYYELKEKVDNTYRSDDPTCIELKNAIQTAREVYQNLLNLYKNEDKGSYSVNCSTWLPSSKLSKTLWNSIYRKQNNKRIAIICVSFEEDYCNVSINIDYKGLNDYTTKIKEEYYEKLAHCLLQNDEIDNLTDFRLSCNTDERFYTDSEYITLINESNLSIKEMRKLLLSRDLKGIPFLKLIKSIRYENKNEEEITNELFNSIDILCPIYDKLIQSFNNLNFDFKDKKESTNPTFWCYRSGHNSCKWNESLANNKMYLEFDKIGDFSRFENKEEIIDAYNELDEANSNKSAYMIYSFCNRIKTGDYIIAINKLKQVLGIGIIREGAKYKYDSTRKDFKNSYDVDWIKVENYQIKSDYQFSQWTFCELNVKEVLDEIVNHYGLFTKAESIDDSNKYSVEDFLKQVYIDNDQYDLIVNLLRYKKNIILQGAPGVGKTFIAKRLAYSMIGYKDEDKVETVQFHQSYSYEDFIMGYKPVASGGFELNTGIFYDFCKKAKEDLNHKYFFIIDEINRGNISKIFGELFCLTEGDKRGKTLKLLYSGEEFTIPKNLYIIGTMNTADRSLAIIDYALRRRFGFIDLTPAFDNEKFKDYMNSFSNPKFNHLISVIKSLNMNIREDESLGEGFEIGHSYFCNLDEKDLTDERLSLIVEFEIIPLLKEYWFDNKSQVDYWSEELRRVLK